MKKYIEYLKESYFYDKMTEEEKMDLVKKNPWNISKINNPSENVQLKAVEINYHVISAISKSTDKVKIFAIKKKPRIIFNFSDISEDVQKVAADEISASDLIDEPMIMSYFTDEESIIKLIKKTNDINVIEYLEKLSKNIIDYIFKKYPNDVWKFFIKFFNKKRNQISYANLITKEIYEKFPIDFIWTPEAQGKIKDYITKEIYYKAPKDYPWIPEIKEKFKDVDRFKRFNL